MLTSPIAGVAEDLGFHLPCLLPPPPWSQEPSLLAILGHMFLGLLIAGATGVTVYWLWDRFAPRA